MGHELQLVADIRVASADVHYRQTENAYGRVPGVAPVRWPREVGWANAMRYLLTGDSWDAETAYRMGVVQEIAPNKDAALKIKHDIANRIAACGPIGIKATLQAAHLAINDSADTAAYAKLEADTCPSSIRKISSRGARLKLKTGLPSSRADKEARPRQRVTKSRK